jgi:hypothetical protein
MGPRSLTCECVHILATCAMCLDVMRKGRWYRPSCRYLARCFGTSILDQPLLHLAMWPRIPTTCCWRWVVITSGLIALLEMLGESYKVVAKLARDNLLLDGTSVRLGRMVVNQVPEAEASQKNKRLRCGAREVDVGMDSTSRDCQAAPSTGQRSGSSGCHECPLLMPRPNLGHVPGV